MQLSSTRVSAGRASASGPSLEALALAAIRRNNGSLWGVSASGAGLFTDSAGTTPVTAVGDVLGLVTDQVYGNANLGPELPVVFSAPANYSNIVTTTGGVTSVISANPAEASRCASLVLGSGATGKSYRVTLRLVSSSGGGSVIAYLREGTSVGLGVVFSNSQNMLPGNTYTFQGISANSAINLLIANNTVGTSFSFDNISVSEVLGNQATQPTTASKPVISALPNGRRAMKFDGSNDLLNLGPGAVLSNASNHWVCAAFILDTLPGTGQLLSIYSSSNTGNDAVLAPYLYLRDDRLLVATWRDQALVEATVTAGSGNITPGLPYVAYAYKSGTTHGLRLNGVVRGEITRSLGGGTTNTANIGMIVRSATTNPFNGKLIVAAGQSTLSDPDRSTIERYLAQQIGAQHMG